jgi:hypothetical protein
MAGRRTPDPDAGRALFRASSGTILQNPDLARL